MNIKSKLLMVFFTIAISSLSIISVVDYIIAEKEITKQIIDKLDGIATAKKSELESQLKNGFGLLTLFSTRPLILEYMDNYKKYGDTKDQNTANISLDAAANAIPEIERISLLDTNGIVVLSTVRQLIGTNMANEDFFVKTSSGASKKYVDIILDNNEPVTMFAIPLYMHNDFVGVLQFIENYDSFSSMYGYDGLGETGEVRVAKRDKTGDALFISEFRFKPNAILHETMSKNRLDTPVIQALLKKESVFTNTVDDREKPILAATRYIADVDWGMVVKIDKDEAFAPLYNMRNLSILVVSISVILVIFSSILFAKSISTPIKKLQKMTHEIADGNIQEKIELKGTDEIRDLSLSINTMVESLQNKIKIEKELSQYKIFLEAEAQANIRKDEFSAMVTHELKTPLVTIAGYAEMLQDLKSLGTLNADQLDAVKEIYANSKKLERLIGDIFDAQKAELKKVKFNMRNFRVDEFMNEMINIHMPLMANKKIDFVNSTKEKMSIKSDDDRIAQVFANLIKNSIDFVPENGRIEINAQSKDNEAVFYVKDNGIGIPKEKQEHLFKKFYQIDTSLQRKHGGTGLGLVICKGLVEGLGGKIWLESDEGIGASFYFSIPK